jgi:hypothetical protein
MSTFISPTGYVDLNNEDYYSLDVKSTRSREDVVPKEDLAFYFQTYIVPKYGLNNINVSNCASIMKDLEMNWTKLDSTRQELVMDILVDGILVNNNSEFRKKFLQKLNIQENSSPNVVSNVFNNNNNNNNNNMDPNAVISSNNIGDQSKSSFGKTNSSKFVFIILCVFILLIASVFLFDKFIGTKIAIRI